MADRILIEGIEFYGFHGCSEAEREIGHRYEVDLEIETDLSGAGATDDLDRTVDYGGAVAIVLKIGEGASVKLMETLAHRIAAALLDEFPTTAGVCVRVRKRLPPVSGIVAAAGVEILRRRP